MKNILPKIILLVSLLAAVVSTGCQRSLVNHQRPVSNFLANSDDSVETLFGIGRISERNGKTDKAIEAYNSILEVEPEHANAMHRMGVIKARKGLINESIAWMKKASQQKAPSAELMGDLGYVLYLNGDLPAAKTMLEKGLQKQPDDARITNNLAIVTGAMQQYNESMDLFRQHGTEAEALASIAYVQTQGGEIDAAKQNYLKSLELDGSLVVAANGLIQLDRKANNADNILHQPLEVEMPSSVQLASYHEENSTQKEVALHEDPVSKIAAPEPQPYVEIKQLASSSKTPTRLSNDKVILASAPSLRTPKKIEAVKAEPVPMELPVVKPKQIPASKKIAAVRGRLRGPAKATVGKAARFQLIVENKSADSASDVTLALELDASMEITHASHKAWLDGKTKSANWTLDTLAAGEVKTIDFDARSNDSGIQTHRLTIKVDGQPVGELSLDTKVE